MRAPRAATKAKAITKVPPAHSAIPKCSPTIRNYQHQRPNKTFNFVFIETPHPALSLSNASPIFYINALSHFSLRLLVLHLIKPNITTTPFLPHFSAFLGSAPKFGDLTIQNMALAAAGTSSLHMAAIKPCISSSLKEFMSSTAHFSTEAKEASCSRLTSSFHISSRQPLFQSLTSEPVKFKKVVTRAMSAANDNKPLPGLPVDLRGKRAFIAGVADDNGYGWAIAKSLAAAGAEIIVGTWVPALNIFESSLRRGKFDESRVLPDGSLMEITKVYPMDAVFDSPEDVPEDIKTNKRYSGSSKWTVQELIESVKQDFGSIDILVHSLANGPEVIKPLLETSRNGYLAAVSASSYSFVSLLSHFVPIMNPGGASISLTYIASERIIPGYGGGMSSAKAALESDTRVLAFEAGRKHKIRVNTISAGPLRSRAAKAIGFIDMMIDYSIANSPLQKELSADEVGNAAAFLASPLASAITGAVLYVDNGLNAMGVGVDSPIFVNLDIPKDN